MTLGSSPFTSRAGSGEPAGTAEGVPPRPVGDAPSVGVVDGLDPMIPFRPGEVRKTAPMARTTVAATARTPASAEPADPAPTTGAAGRAAAHLDAFAPGRLVESLRGPVPVLGDGPDEGAELGVVGR